MNNRPLHTIQDFLDALDQDPELRKEVQRHILTGALLNLPALIGQPADGSETVVAQLKGLDGRMEGLEARMDTLDGRMEGLDGRMEGLETRMDTLDTRMARVDVRSGNAEGRAYEIHAARNMGYLLYLQLGMRVARPVYRCQADDPDLFRQMNNAAPEARQLTQEEIQELIETIDDDLVDAVGVYREEFIVHVYQGRDAGVYSDNGFGQNGDADEG